MSHRRLFVLRGSQFSAKAMVALDSRNIAFTLQSMPFDAKKRRELMPAPSNGDPRGTSVPVLEDADGTVVADSEAILRHLDASGAAVPPFYPNDAVASLDAHIGRSLNALGPLYHNWVNEATFSASIGAYADRSLPGLLRGWVPWRVVLWWTRDGYRAKVRRDLDLPPDADLSDADAIQRRLVDALRRIQDEWLVEGVESQKYLVAGATAPSAADCSLYAILDRCTGSAGDAHIPAALPQFWAEHAELGRLGAWYDVMKSRHPIVFKRGK